MALFNGKERAGSPEAVTLVGEEAYFHGVLAAKGSVRVEGVVEGDITDAINAEIGKKGKVKGNIAAENLSIAGLVEGDIICSRAIEILAGGRVTGNIKTARLRIEDGAMFDGNCSMLTGEEPSHSISEAQAYRAAEKA